MSGVRGRRAVPSCVNGVAGRGGVVFGEAPKCLITFSRIRGDTLTEQSPGGRSTLFQRGSPLIQEGSADWALTVQIEPIRLSSEPPRPGQGPTAAVPSSPARGPARGSQVIVSKGESGQGVVFTEGAQPLCVCVPCAEAGFHPHWLSHVCVCVGVGGWCVRICLRRSGHEGKTRGSGGEANTTVKSLVVRPRPPLRGRSPQSLSP